ncbi:hypothetical protein ITJ38_10035 [Agreia pratensis]|uniref:hypothetical protein n=1 Tax=Agreia pratensis TaxID=150121 RepID=UPI00188D053F|nr:hypothetical protein [Agreia pratensis]MBF4634739.1 hypothetical protein [Agreia pratensis]
MTERVTELFTLSGNGLRSGVPASLGVRVNGLRGGQEPLGLARDRGKDTWVGAVDDRARLAHE